MRPMNLRPRVAVIGGGSVGALCAARLAEGNFDVTLIEKAAIGNGSSSRSAACIRAQFGKPETVVGMMYSEAWYDRFNEHLRVPRDEQVDVISHNGYLFLYEDPQANPQHDAALASAWATAVEAFDMQRSVGLDVELLTPAEVADRWPHISPDNLIGATWCPRDGFLLTDPIYTQGVRWAKELGATVLTYTEVTGAEHENGRITALRTTKGSIEVDYIVNATNAWAPRISRTVGGMEIPVKPEKRYLWYWDPTAEFLTAFGERNWRQLPMTIYGMGGNRGVYSRPDGTQLMIGWAHDADPEYNFTDEDQDTVASNFHHTNRGDEARASMASFVPDLIDDGRWKTTTAGYYATTPDHTPMIGYDTQRSNLLHAVGCSGHGLMHAPITAFLVEALLTENVDPEGRVYLPAPFNTLAIDTAAFAPTRSFDRDEMHVI